MQPRVSKAWVSSSSFGVDAAALGAVGQPRRADLQATVGFVDVHVGGHPHDLTISSSDRERQHHPGLPELQPSLDLAGHAGRVGHAGVAQLPESPIGGGSHQIVMVLDAKGRQMGDLTGESDGIGESHGSSLRDLAFTPGAWDSPKPSLRSIKKTKFLSSTSRVIRSC